MSVPSSAGAQGGQSFLALPIVSSNFLPTQSAQLAVGTTSAAITFSTMPPGTIHITAKITNKGTHGAYIAYSNSATGTVAAVTSSSTPAANCDYAGAGAILQQDYPPGTNTFSAIQDGGSTTLEISVGYGQ